MDQRRYSVRCPTCHVGAGVACRAVGSRKWTYPHVARDRLTGPVDVHLACNDDGGNFDGKLRAVSFHDITDHALSIMARDEDGVPFTWDEKAQLLLLGPDPADAFTARGRASWVGNMAWEGTCMPMWVALEFARYLLLTRDFDVTDCVLVEPWLEFAA